jgi:hypothetical protein
MAAMRSLSLTLLLALLSACQAPSSVRPVEYLDERTALTVGSLKEPIELVPDAQTSAAARLMGRHISFAYLGPVEWDRSGQVEYGLWVHVAPGSGQQIADIRSPSAVTLVTDDGSLALKPLDAPQMGHSAYQPVASWGQTAYFELAVATLRQMAKSQKLALIVLAADGGKVSYFTSADTRTILNEFIKSRAITGD